MEILGTVTQKSHVLSTPIQYQLLQLAKKLKLQKTQISESFISILLFRQLLSLWPVFVFNRAVVDEETK